MSHPSYEEFYAALADPSRRPLIGLVISDDDAWSLLENDEWARDYYDEWVALAPARDADVVAPAAGESASDATDATPKQSPASPAVPVVETADAAQPAPSAGMPRWAVAAIVGGAAVALLGAVGIGALVYTGVGATGDAAARSGMAPSEEQTADGSPDAGADGTAMPWEEGYVAPYSDDDAAAYLEIVEPLFGSESSTALSQSYLLFGSSACVSLEAGFAEPDIVTPIVEASAGKLTADEGQAMIDAAKTYLCE